MCSLVCTPRVLSPPPPPGGEKWSLSADDEMTVGEFKALLVEKCAIPVEQQRLIYKGYVLKDTRTIESYGQRRERRASETKAA